MKIWIFTAGCRFKTMKRNLLMIGLSVLLLRGTAAAEEPKHSMDMEFIEFLGTFEKDVDPLMLSDTAEPKKDSLKSSPQGPSYERKKAKQKDTGDE